MANSHNLAGLNNKKNIKAIQDPNTKVLISVVESCDTTTLFNNKAKI